MGFWRWYFSKIGGAILAILKTPKLFVNWIKRQDPKEVSFYGGVLLGFAAAGLILVGFLVSTDKAPIFDIATRDKFIMTGLVLAAISITLMSYAFYEEPKD